MGIIPNIKIEINTAQTMAIVDALSQLDTTLPSQWHKTTVSILEMVLEKLLKKQIANRHKTKSFKLELEYFQAYFLKEFLLKYNSVLDRHYVQVVINQLDQKLA